MSLLGIPALAVGSVRPGVLVGPLGIWVVVALLAIANGVFRESVLVPRVGDATAQLISTALLIVVILLVSFAYFSTTAIAFTWTEVWVVGVVWVVLTAGFEFVIGYVEGTPVAVTLGQYNVLAGEVWIFVQLTLLVAPVVFGWYFAGG